MSPRQRKALAGAANAKTSVPACCSSRAVSPQPELVNFHSVRPPRHKTHTRKRAHPPSSGNIPHKAPCRYPAELRMCAPATFTHLGAHYSDVTHGRIRDVFPTLFPVPSTLSSTDTPPPTPLILVLSFPAWLQPRPPVPQNMLASKHVLFRKREREKKNIPGNMTGNIEKPNLSLDG